SKYALGLVVVVVAAVVVVVIMIVVVVVVVIVIVIVAAVVVVVIMIVVVVIVIVAVIIADREFVNARLACRSEGFRFLLLLATLGPLFGAHLALLLALSFPLVLALGPLLRDFLKDCLFGCQKERHGAALHCWPKLHRCRDLGSDKSL